MIRARILTLLCLAGGVSTAAAIPLRTGGDLMSTFGRAVAISGDYAFVGEPSEASGRGGGEGPAVNPAGVPGIVHVYRRGPLGWKEAAKLGNPGSAARDGFGAALAADGASLLVGQVVTPVAAGGRGGGRGAVAPPPVDTSVGAVFVYHRGADGKYVAQGTLSGAGARPGAQFGVALALMGDMALVGAPSDSSGGAVFVYHRASDGSWSQAGTLPAQGLVTGDRFGAAIAINADRVAVGAPAHDIKGAVYVFRHGTDGSWTQESSLESRTIPDDAQLGAAVAFRGDRIVAGAPGASLSTAAPAVNPAAGANGGRAGGASALQGGVPGPGALQAGVANAAGAPNGTVTGSRAPGGAAPAAGRAAGAGGGRGGAAASPVTGMVLVFDQNPAKQWRVTGTFTPFDFAAARFGAAVAIVGDELWVGAPMADGMGRIFRVQADKDGSWTGMTKLAVDTLDAGAQFAATFAVAGDAAVVGMPGDGGGGGTVAFLGKSPTTGTWSLKSLIFPPVPDLWKAVAGKEVKCGDNGKAADFPCSNTGLLSFMPISELGGKRGIRMSSMWGWTDPVTGHDIAILGRTDGAAFVDVTDPVRPRYLGDLMRTAGATTSAWREIKTYRNFAFIVSDGSGDHHGIQIFDLTRLRTVTTPQRFTEDAHYYTGSVHDIAIDTATGFAYALGTSTGGQTCNGGLQMVDIHDPKNPQFAGCFSDPGTGRRGQGYTHDAQCVVYHGPDTRYTGHEVCIAANETHISIQDVTDKSNVKVLSHVTYPSVSYAHQGWFTDDQKFWYEDDELDEGGFPGTTGANGNGPNCPCGKAVEGTRTLIWDMTDLTDPILAKEFIGTTHATDHNQFVKGNRLYQSNYRAGLRILDISDPVNPREVGYLDTYPLDDAKEGGGTWSNYPWFKNGMIGVVSTTEGFFMVRDNTKKIIP